jgi:formylglycine-generating enzyme required for sulfatase activity
LANADVGDGSLRRRADELAAAVGDLRGRVQAEAESLGRALESVSDRSSLGPESAEGSTAGQDVAAYGVRSAATLAGRTEISDAFAELRAATVSGRYREGVRGAERLAASLDRATFGRQSVRRLQGLSNECGRLSEMIRAGRFLVAREGLQRLIAATSPLQNGWAGDTPELESIGSAPTLRRAIEARLERHERILADPEVAQLRRTRQLEVSVGAEAERRSNLRVLAESRRAEWAATQLQILGALASIGSFDPEAAKQKDVVALMGQLRELRIEGDRRFEELNQALVLTEDLSSLNAVAQLERLARLDEERLIALSRLSGELVARQGAGGIRRDLAELEAQSLYWMAQATIAKSRSTGGQGSAIPAALVHLESGLDALPEHPLLKTAQVELLLEIHQYQQALDAATGAMAAAVSTTARGAGAASARLHLARSRAFRALGRPQESARDLVEALALHPSRAVLMHFFAESRKAEAALIPSQVESVINSIQSVFPHDDDSIDANSRLSAGEWLLQLAGPAGLAEAVEQCRIAFASAFFETPTEVSRRRFRELATEPLWAPVRALDEWRVVESRFSAATPPGMVRIPETTFMMGSAREDDPREERLARRVTVTSFLMDAREVSVADYAAFVEAQGGRIAPPPDWALQKRQPDDPVRGVDWHAAMAYAKWNGKSLPSEAQWEAAARGADSRPYPWGTAMDDRQWQSRPSSTSGSIAPPTWDVTTEGVIGLAFGVREWTRDDFLPDYHRTRLHDGIQNPEVVGEGLVKTVKGGHHRVGRPYHVQPMRRQGVNADAMDPTIGFRCVIP